METLITANLPHILIASIFSFLILYIINHIKTVRNKTKERKELEKKAARKVIDDLIRDFKKQKEREDIDRK